ncbi:MAG: hypothetical protein JO016_11330 [Actinobacteria bacterium]|nr:hypothetical protein [Actinomycetota bacterium]
MSDAVRGGLTAWIGAANGRVLPGHGKRPLATVACAVMVFAVAIAGLAKMREGKPFDSVTRAHVTVAVALDVLRATAGLAALAVLAGAAPLAWVVFRQMIVDRRPGLLGPLTAGLATAVGWSGAVWITARLAGAHQGTGPDVLVVTALAVSGAAAVVICAWAVTTVIRRMQLPGRLFRAEIPAMAMLSLSMAAVTAADVAWGLAVRSADAGLFNSDNGLISTPLAPNWAGSAVVLLAVTVVTCTATARAARAAYAPAGS